MNNILKKLEKIKEFKELKKELFAVVLYGSFVEERMNNRSDVDVCLVLKTRDEKRIDNVYREVSKIMGKTEKYDVKIFELMPLKLKFEVIDKGKILYSKDYGKLQEYFYFYIKLWQDQSINWLEKKNLIK